MNITDIFEMWKKDSDINRIELGDNIAEVGNLHAKYLQLYFEERTKLLELKTKQAKLKKIRWEYWNGKLSEDDLKKYGWPPQPLIILKMDLPLYIDSDDIMIQINTKVDLQTEKVNILDSIIKAISQRGYTLNTLLNWEKFHAGQ